MDSSARRRPPAGSPRSSLSPNTRGAYSGALRRLGRLARRPSPRRLPRRTPTTRGAPASTSTAVAAGYFPDLRSATPPARTRPGGGLLRRGLRRSGGPEHLVDVVQCLDPSPALVDRGGPRARRPLRPITCAASGPSSRGGGRCEAPDGQRLAGAYFRDRLARPASGGGSGPSAAPLSSPPATGGGVESDEVTLERGRLDARERGAPPHGRDAAGDPRPAPSSPSSAPASADECSRHAMARSLYWRVSPQPPVSLREPRSKQSRTGRRTGRPRRTLSQGSAVPPQRRLAYGDSVARPGGTRHRGAQPARR